jgi:hypothetical protein
LEVWVTPEQQSPAMWLARSRGKRQLNRHRTLMDKLFGGADGDSDESSSSATVVFDDS